LPERTHKIILVKIAGAMAIIASIFAFLISSESRGMDNGFRISDKEISNHWEQQHKESSEIRFSISGAPTYEYLAVSYNHAGFLFLLLAVAFSLLLFKSLIFRLLSILISIPSSVLIIFLLRNQIRSKQIVESYFWDSPRNAFARLTLTYDWTFATISFVLIIIYVGLVISLLATRRK